MWSNITAGQHTLTFIADVDDQIPESKEDNNQRTITFMVDPCTAPIGGTWISPDDGFLLAGQIIHFAVHASASAGVNRVEFTVTWPGAGRRVVCKATAPSYDDVYQCDWKIDIYSKSGVPNGGSGPITVSFDVYDNADNNRLAPDGTRKEGTAWNPPMHNWTVIGYQPGQGDHTGRDFWAVDLTSSDLAVYPVRPGKVVFAGWNCSKAKGNKLPYCYGNVVVVAHDSGLYSIYAHLQDGGFPVKGTLVGTNTQIGWVDGQHGQRVATFALRRPQGFPRPRRSGTLRNEHARAHTAHTIGCKEIP
jgi:hypothetical protein